MSGLFGLSVNPQTYKGDLLFDLFWGTFYEQHLGEEYAGLSTCRDKKIQIRTHRGLFRPTFKEDLRGLEGTEGIGYCGSTREPFLVDSKLGEFSSCFSGNVINLDALVERFKGFGHSFARNGDDIEIITKIIAQGNDIPDGIKRAASEIEGTYSLLLLTKEGIYATLSPDAHWPLVIGQKEGAVAIASESGCFSNLGFTLVRDLDPGEIILIKDGQWATQEIVQSERVQTCSFLWVYTTFPNAVIRGISASLVRKRLGACHARRDITRGFTPDIVTGVPDSGRFHAIGYFQEFCRQFAEGRIDKLPRYEEVLIKFPYAGRSYTPQEEAARKEEAKIKLLPAGESFQGLTLVFVDDSLVRGTQTKTDLVPKVKSLGFQEVHGRFSNPELLSHCRWGKTTKRGETLASNMPLVEDRVAYLGLDSLEYNTIDELVEAIGLPREQLCVDCDLPPQ